VFFRFHRQPVHGFAEKDDPDWGKRQQQRDSFIDAVAQWEDEWPVADQQQRARAHALEY